MSGQHQTGKRLKRYREMLIDLGGLPEYAILKKWMQKDFNSVFEALLKADAILQPCTDPDFFQEQAAYLQHALEAVDTAEDFARVLTEPTDRYRMIKRIEALLRVMKKSPHAEPAKKFAV